MLDEYDNENKVDGQQASRVWDPKKLKTIIKQQIIKASGQQQQSQTWDLGGFQHIEGT